MTSLSLLCSLFLIHRVVSQSAVDISGCCTHIKIETSGEASTHQGNRIGEYLLTGVLAERPIYKNKEREEYLFYLQSKNKGLWMVGPTAGQFNGGLAHRGDTHCVENVPANQWKYTDGSAWHRDESLRVSCLDQVVTPQCMYNDQTQFVGGDLPEVFGGGGVETSMESSADCIEECEKRSGCKYWTWVMGEKINCFLKNSRVETVRKPKYVSGSIPKACTSTPPTATNPPSTYSVCTYANLDFKGGDLFAVVADDVDDCRQQCDKHVSCKLFTFDKKLERGCYFKTDQVKVVANKDVVSGAITEICEDFILPHVTKEEEEPKYNENEINGKFKITSLRWDEKLNDPNSQEYQDLSNTIEDSLESMLRSERDLDEQADFTVQVKKFKKGSVVCDFKVNYILKEAYIAIPFAIKPSNITDAMNKNFKFKKGILFQRFLIAANSFNASSPVDHCAAKGCSHKCDYDYDIEDYVCTCPRNLQLDNAGLNCITPEEAATEKSVVDESEEVTTAQSKAKEETDLIEDTTTIVPEIKLTLLPTNCLWSPWSDWTECSTSCGNGKKERQRSVVIPEQNGGFCPGRSEEFVECNEDDCEDTAPHDEYAGEFDDKVDEAVTELIKDVDSTEQEILMNEEDQTTEYVEDAFGTKVTTESTLLEDDNEESLVNEVVTESILEDDSDISTKTDGSIGESITTTVRNDVDITTDAAHSIDNDDNNTKIMFPLTADDEASTTTESITTILTTTNIVFPTEEPVFSVDVPFEETTDKESMISDETSTKPKSIQNTEEITTESVKQIDDVEDEKPVDISDSETTTQLTNETDMNKEKESTSMRNVEHEISTIRLESVDGNEVEVTTTIIDDGEDTLTTELGSGSRTTTESREDSEVEETEITTVKSVKDTAIKEDGDSETTTYMNYLDDESEMESGMDESKHTDVDTDDVTQEETTTVVNNMDSTMKDKSPRLDTSNEVQTTEAIYNDDEGEAFTADPNTIEEVLESTTVRVISVDEVGDEVIIVTSAKPITDSEMDDLDETKEQIDEGTTTEKIEETAMNNITGNVNIDTTTISPENATDESIDIARNIDNETIETKSPEETTDESIDTTGNIDEETLDTKSPEETTDESTETTRKVDEETLDTKSPEETTDESIDTIGKVDEETLDTKFHEETTDESIDTTGKVDEETLDTKSPEETTDESIDTTRNVDEETPNTKSTEETTDRSIDTTVHSYEETSDENPDTKLDEDTADENIDINTVAPEETTDEALDTTTITSEIGDHEFLCKETGDDNTNVDIPLKCVLTNGDEELTVRIVIPGDTLNGDKKKLFDKNVKIVVKDFMIMDRSPRTLS